MFNRVSFQIHLTGDCNLKCLHCYNENRGIYLDAEQFGYILDQVLKYKKFIGAMPGRAIFCGGEPTLSPILFDCLKETVKAGFTQVSVLTNGTLVTEDFARRLVESGCSKVQICIEGDEKTHNSVRQGTWGDVLRAWDICKKRGLHVSNQTTVTPLNYRQIDQIIHTCMNRVHDTSFLRQIPHNRKMELLTPLQWMEVLERIFYGYCHYGEDYKEFVYVRDIHWSHLFLEDEYCCSFQMDPPLLPIIECNGDVYLCRRSGIVVGNVFRESLINILTKNERLRQIRKRENLNPKCRRCHRVDLCGGCRGMAFAVNKDVMAEDPQCILNELGMDQMSEMEKREKRMGLRGLRKNKSQLMIAEMLSLIRLLKRYSSTFREKTERKIALEKAKEKGVKISAKELQKAVDTFRKLLGLEQSKDMEKWMESNGISMRGLQDCFETNLLLHKLDNIYKRISGKSPAKVRN